MKKGIAIIILMLITVANVTALSQPEYALAGADTYFTARILLEGLTQESQKDKGYWRNALEPSLVSAVAIAAPVGIMLGATKDTDDWFYGVALSFGVDMAVHTIYYIAIKSKSN